MSSTVLIPQNDPMGQAIYEFHKTGKAEDVVVHSSMFDDDVIPIETLFRKSYATPLLKSVTVNLNSVAEFRKKRLDISLPSYVAVEYLVNKHRNVLENIPAVNIGLVVRRGRCNIEVVAVCSVEFGVNSV